MSKYVITYDIGTTGIKTCLIEIDDTMHILGSSTAGYNLYVDEETGVKGGAEQDADEWWGAMCSTTREVFEKVPDVSKEQIEGISFCSAMQGLVLVDKEGNCIRRPMTYMDQRAREEIKKGIAHGFQIAGAEVTKLLKYLKYTGAVSSSVKDPIWKYKWVEAHEPENFRKIYKWLDIKEYLICRASGEFVMTTDSAFATLLYDTRKGHEGWCKPICDMVGVNIEHLPPIKKSTDKVGEITEKAANELGLAPGTAVYGGGGDASLIGVGAGAVEVGDTHIYSGTSGWVGTVVDKQVVDAGAMMAAIVGADPESFNYFGELETSNKCVGWVKDHLALDEIGVFLKRYGNAIDSLEQVELNMYDYLEEVIERAKYLRDTARIFFTVENMNYLIHGGRVGKLAGVAANVLNLRPMILMTQGELFPMGLARGRVQSKKKAMEKLFSYIKENGNDPDKFAYIVGYGYDKEEGEKLRSDARKQFEKTWPDKKVDIDISQIGMTIGVHTGPYPIGFGLIEKAC